MPSFCAVLNCCDKYGHAESISFHKFPFKRKDLLQKWIEFAHRGPDWKPTKWSAVCSQHFAAEDFNCANARKTLKKTAVPTVKALTNVDEAYTVEPKHLKSSKERQLQTIATTANAEQFNYVYEGRREETKTVSAKVTKNPTLSLTNFGGKANCRLCSVAAAAACSFSTNFEIFGMIQKCFPTLNIQQDDHLPKDICQNCLQQLNNFSEFIDKVLETQCALQQKYRADKQTKSLEQRSSLKIKQEPSLVKVKQEVAEGGDGGAGGFLCDDLDVASGGIDGCCFDDPEPDAVSVDQKLSFYDLPLINAQDIINNCDIMEIINLDDPFINIPDDDQAATISSAAAAAAEPSPTDRMPLLSAHQLLQSHMLIDEHNYACPAEDLKDEWQIKKCCKVEEETAVVAVASAATTLAQIHTTTINARPMMTPETALNYQTNNCTPINNAFLWESAFAANDEQRSNRPIVTSVSAIAESRHPTASGDKFFPLAAAAANLTQSKCASSHGSSSSKPNIVVLNESIVKSTEAFQLHACDVCQLKFFSVESLQQHLNVTHVSGACNVPSTTLPAATDIIQNNNNHNMSRNINNDNTNNNNNNSNNSNNKSNNSNNEDSDKTSAAAINQHYNNNEANRTNAVQPNIVASLENTNSIAQKQETTKMNAMNDGTHQDAVFSTTLHSSDDSWTRSANEIYAYEHKADATQHVAPTNNATLEASDTQTLLFQNMTTSAKEIEMKIEQKKENNNKLVPLPRKRNNKRLKVMSKMNQKTVTIAAATAAAASTQTLFRKVATSPLLPQQYNITNYNFLQRRYRLLLRKCKALQDNCDTLARQHKPAAVAATAMTTATMQHVCSHCDNSYDSIYQLLLHKQQQHRRPTIRNSSSRGCFYANCSGCEKYFRSKRALSNHMRYICQTLSLRWLKTQLQTFKCRACRSISFTHWRLLRNHEISCKRKIEQRKNRCQQKLQLQQQLQRCPLCRRKFANARTLSLHMSAKHHAEWHLSCLQCNCRLRHLNVVAAHYATGACRLSLPRSQSQSQMLPVVAAAPESPPNCAVRCCNCQQTFSQLHQLLLHYNCRPNGAAATQHRRTPPSPSMLPSSKTTRQQQFACNICHKHFASANSLWQHRITHSEQKRHNCGLCERVFKRRGGLTQHLKGFHLQLKPHECSVCKHRYALKCDMQRCRHSTLQKRSAIATNA